MAITFETHIKSNSKILQYIKAADSALSRMGYTEHNVAHVTYVLKSAEYLLKILGYDEHTIDLTKIACYMHDIGNALSRYHHNLIGGILATQLLQEIGLPLADVCLIANAICSHDTPPGTPTTPIAAALIIADKCDVRRSRVRKESIADFDIHDRVHYSIFYSKLTLEDNVITLVVNMDPEVSSKYEYYEIFLDRMHMCKEAAKVLNCDFELKIE